MHYLVRMILGACLALTVQAGIAQACDGGVGAVISTTVEADVSASKDAVFAFTVAQDVLPKVLWNHGIIPGVSHTEVLRVPSWDQPGALRIVYLNDGNTAHEEITDFERSDYFAYKVFDFTGMTGALAQQARGQWWFEEQDGKTHVRWTYTFAPKCGLSRFILDAVVVPSFNGYMKDALSRIKADVEASNQGSGR